MEQIFPFTLVTLDVCAAIVYVGYADWRRAIYWFAAAVLTLCVTI